MKGLHHKIAKILESDDFSSWQKLNSFFYYIMDLFLTNTYPSL